MQREKKEKIRLPAMGDPANQPFIGHMKMARCLGMSLKYQPWQEERGALKGGSFVKPVIPKFTRLNICLNTAGTTS